MADDIKIGLSADVAALLKGFEAARESGLSLRRAISGLLPPMSSFAVLEREIQREGIKTTKSIEGQIVKLKGLQKSFENDSLASAQFKSRIEDLERQLESLNKSTSSAVPPFDALANAQNTLSRLGIVTAKSIERQVAQLERLKKAFRDDAVVVDQLNKRIAALNSSFGRGSSSGLAGGASRATNTLINFNRVVQDAPFGILGIANNIDPLLESFGRLRRETGGTGSALKALVAAISGPAGIISAVSLGTSLFIAFGDKIAEAFGQGKQAAEEAKKAFQDAINEVVKFEGIEVQPVEVNAGNLLKVLDNAKKSIKTIEAQIKDLEGSLIGGGGPVSFTGNASEFRTRAQSSSTARVLIGRLKERLELNKEIVKQLEGQKKSLEAQVAIAQDLRSFGGVDFVELDQSAPSIPGQGIIEDFVSKDGITTTKQAAQAMREFEQAKIDNIAKNIKLQETEQKLLDTLNNYKVTQRENTFESGLRADAAVRERDALKDLQATVNELIQENNAEFAEAVNTVEFFGGAAAQALGDMLAGFEKLEDIGKILGNIFRDLAAQIAAAAAKAALLSFLFPGAAAGKGFKGLFKGFLGLTPFASGGIVTGPTPALIGEAGPEAVIPLDRLSSMGSRPLEVKALRISGGDLLLTLQEAQNTRGNGGISLS